MGEMTEKQLEVVAGLVRHLQEGYEAGSHDGLSFKVLVLDQDDDTPGEIMLNDAGHYVFRSGTG